MIKNRNTIKEVKKEKAWRFIRQACEDIKFGRIEVRIENGLPVLIESKNRYIKIKTE